MTEAYHSPINFSLKTEDDFLTEQYRSRIAFINNVRIKDVKWEELRDNRQRLRSFGLYKYEKYLGHIDTETCVPKIQEVLQQIEGLFDEEIDSFSFGVYAPTFARSIINYAKDNPDRRKKYSSLLAGAFTKATVAEYAGVSRRILPAADLSIIDIDGKWAEEVSQGAGVKFYRGDATNMPFEKESFDMLMSEHLIRSINNAGRYHYFDAYKAFAGNAIKILKPGGKITMIDDSLMGVQPDYFNFLGFDSYDDTPDKINRNLHIVNDILLEQGFEVVKLGRAFRFKSRRDLDRHIMLGNTWDIPDGAITENNYHFVVEATKPTQQG